MAVKNNKNILEDTLILENKVDNNGDVEVSCSNNFGLGVVFTLSILLVLGLIVVFFPRIVLNGSENIFISYNENYIEEGYNGYIFNENITDNMRVVNDVQNGVIGEYEINYYIDLFGARVKKTRKVNVVDNVSPVIKVDKEVIQVCPLHDVPDIEYEATDEYDGDITDRVEKIVSENEIKLQVDDFSKNITSLIVKINRTDNEKPVIKLKGSSLMYLTYGNKYKEPGYSASDNCSGDLTNKVKVSGSVGRDIGSYYIKYEVTDDTGNTTDVTRKVIVLAKVKDNGSVNKGTVYLTFDDGPNYGTTNKILDVLKDEGVKATFFVTCKGPDSLIKRIYEEGHTIALHTASHNYSQIYSSVENYFKDLEKVSARVKKITGVDSKIIRFPGGSSNSISRNYNKGIMTELTNIVLSKGYRYFDWNVDAKDASSARNSKDVYYNVTSGLSHNRANVVLMHDTKSITASAIRDIIKYGKENGYKFSEIDMNTYMVRHKVRN